MYESYPAKVQASFKYELIIKLRNITFMRKTTQSLYQSNIKAPLASSKVLDGSHMFKSTSGIPGATKKVEGQDLSKSTGMKRNFEQTVSNLKNKPTQKVLQQQYISGLQQEIKYLEYELKLLKDKQILEREGVNELDNFLKDEIPINENILAMKNKYNSTKTQLQQKYSDIRRKIETAEQVLKSQKEDIQKYHKCIDTHRKQVSDRKVEFKQKLSQLVKQVSITRDEYENLSIENKKKLEQIKKFNESIAVFQRKIEKEKVQQVREVENKQKSKEKFDQKFKLVKQQLIESLQKMDQLEAYGEINPLISPVQQQNSSLRKKIMLNDKQRSTAENIIAQIELFLKEEQREREVQRQQKGKLVVQSESYRTQIQHLQRYVENLIKDQVFRHKSKWLKQMSITLQEKQQSYELLVDRLRNLQQECSNLIQQKKQLNDALQSEKAISQEFDEKIDEQVNSIITSKSRTDSLIRITSEINSQIPPTRGELEKCRGRIPMVEKDIQRKKVTIQYLNKQVDLLKQLKTLDLEQLQMISQGGSNVQNTLHSFIKNWEKIKSSTSSS